MISRRHTLQLLAAAPLFPSQRSLAAPGGISEASFLRIGGIEQWIAIQGSDARNPVILYLHGGPGEAQSPFLHQFGPWEKDFTVVNWDQRGAGRTFGRNGPSIPGMTLDRLVNDAIELAEQMCRRLSQRKVVLVGQSWGSLLGVHVIKRRPELFHAFVGTGQVVSIAATATDGARWARRQATESNDQETLKALNAAALMSGLERTIAEFKAARKYAMSGRDQEYAQMMKQVLGVAGFNDTASIPERGDVADWFAGTRLSSSTFGDAVMNNPETNDLRKLGSDMPIPFFVIQGREDHVVSVDAAQAYVDSLRAPAKAFIPIAGGHWACFTNTDAFVSALRKHVRPLAVNN